MKKTLAFIISGSLLVGSATYALAMDGGSKDKEVEEDIIVITVDADENMDLNDLEAVKQYLNLEDVSDEEVLDILRDFLIVIEKKEVEETIKNMSDDELINLFQSHLDQLDQEKEETENDPDSEAAEEEEKPEDEDEDEGKGEDNTDDDKAESEEDIILDEVLDRLNRKKAHFEALYDRLPAPAKPAMMKNIQKTELKIFMHLNETGQEVVEEAVATETIDEIETKEEVVNDSVLDTKDLRREIQREFLQEKKQQIEERKEEKAAAKVTKKESASNNKRGNNNNNGNNGNGNNNSARGNNGNNGNGRGNN